MFLFSAHLEPGFVIDHPPFFKRFQETPSPAWNDLAEGKKPPKIEGFHEGASVIIKTRFILYPGNDIRVKRFFTGKHILFIASVSAASG